MVIDLTEIIKAFIALLAAVITGFLVPYIKAKTTAEQRAKIVALIKAGVLAAEQIYKADGIGAKKLEYVRNYLMRNGYEVDTTEIEAVVAEYLNLPELIGGNNTEDEEA